jgi:hypothetical protein
VTFLSAGPCSLAANQAGTANFFPGAQVLLSFTVFPGSQIVTFTSIAPVASVSGPTYTVSATASSGLVVTFSIDAASVSVCTIAGSVISFIGSGDCRVLGMQNGGVNFNPASPALQVVTVLPGSQTVTFTSNMPTNQTVGGARYNVTGTSNRGLPVVVTIDLSSASVCTVASNSVSFVGVGTCIVNLDGPPSLNYAAAPRVTQSFSVARGNQAVVFVNGAPSPAYVGGLTFSALAIATSGLPVTVSVAPSSVGVCSVNGFTVSFLSNATCTLIASQPGDTSE